MAWFLMLLAVGCLLVPFVTKSFALGVLCLMLSLVFLVAGAMMLLSARITSASRKAENLSPEELRVLREQAQAKRASSAGTPSGTTPESPPRTPV
jgi:hypothetical protein